MRDVPEIILASPNDAPFQARELLGVLPIGSILKIFGAALGEMTLNPFGLFQNKTFNLRRNLEAVHDMRDRIRLNPELSGDFAL